MGRPSIDDVERAFFNKLQRARASIVRDADGRTCGECTHAVLGASGQGYCQKYLNYEGNALQISRRDAFACRKGFEAVDS